MPRSPDEPVVRDSQATLWAMMREGLYNSSEVSASGHWHPSRATTPWQSIRAQTPFGRQERPVVLQFSRLSIVPQSPNDPPTSPPLVRAPLGGVVNAQVNALRRELLEDDHKRAAEDTALRKIREGMRELDLARQM